MQVIKARPPNWDAIVAAFPFVLRRHGVMFCYGDTVFAPGGAVLDESVEAHEMVHSRRQGADPARWWEMYIASPRFRLNEEIPAHVEEYRVIRSTVTERIRRRMYLRQIAQRLSGPLYGSLVTFDEAKRLIRTLGA